VQAPAEGESEEHDRMSMAGALLVADGLKYLEHIAKGMAGKK
jgi:hypothetical protein